MISGIFQSFWVVRIYFFDHQRATGTRKNGDFPTTEKQANEIVEEMRETLEEEGFEVAADREIVALIAYLQRLGVDIEKGNQTAEN